jgi:hypothetical protein
MGSQDLILFYKSSQFDPILGQLNPVQPLVLFRLLRNRLCDLFPAICEVSFNVAFQYTHVSNVVSPFNHYDYNFVCIALIKEAVSTSETSNINYDITMLNNREFIYLVV